MVRAVKKYRGRYYTTICATRTRSGETLAKDALVLCTSDGPDAAGWIRGTCDARPCDVHLADVREV